ncbi:single-stranded DNA-binding protein [Deinococcus sp. Leaf326]|uniref:single-stranded DNA-binding protein n=1 Tax=Deinococcus sp. Leaf326 TaxID=1736338 RepID=UPI0006FDBA9E|nr:single-stranded DNA-binding protein [Deinococcus sp. Leaf326]KQR35155.1 hypothetical protein ASF71_16370 [Deinococcus sp. Leaf326]
MNAKLTVDGTSTNGMISGCVIRVEDHTRPQAKVAGRLQVIVTIAGETLRNGTPLIFFEQVRLQGKVAENALTLQRGECVLFDQASIEQLIWNDPHTQAPRAKLIVRASAFTRIKNNRTRLQGNDLIMEYAANAFTLNVRIAKLPLSRETRAGRVTEVTLAANLRNSSEPDDDTKRVHYFKVNAWRELGFPFEDAPTGKRVICEVLIKTNTNDDTGERRYFTELEARTVSVFA